MAMNSGLMLFDKPVISTDIEQSHFVDYYPISSLQSGPIEFYIPGGNEEYVDCNDIYLQVRFKVVNKDGKPLKAVAEVATVNSALSSLFQDVRVLLNEKQVEGGDNGYPYKSYIAYLTQFDKQSKDTHLEVTGWEKDEKGKMDDKANAGWVQRKTWIAESRECEFFGPLNLDLCRQSRYLLSHVNMRIILNRTSSDFFLMEYDGGSPYKHIITKAVLYVRRAVIKPSIINAHAVGLKRQNALYPINHTRLTTFTIGTGKTSETRDNLFPSQMPKMLFIAMVDNAAYNGDSSKNPFNLQNFNLNRIALYCNGRAVMMPAFEPDFDKDKYSRAFCATSLTMGYFNKNRSCGLRYDMFGNGYTVFAYDLTADNLLQETHGHEAKAGNVRLELTFSKALAAPINVLLYAIYESSIEITETRDVIANYHT